MSADNKKQELRSMLEGKSTAELEELLALEATEFDAAGPNVDLITAALEVIAERENINEHDAQLTEQTKNEVIYQGKSLGITSVAVGSDQEGLYHLMIRTERDDAVRITLPTNFLDGNAHGFSQSQNLCIEYDGVVYSKANGSSGTVTAGIYGDSIRIEATNYNNLEVIYEGPYETDY
jgi:hypothetical protein